MMIKDLEHKSILFIIENKEKEVKKITNNNITENVYNHKL
jgi:hypothetical protein